MSVRGARRVCATDLPVPDGVPRNSPAELDAARRTVLRLGARHWVDDDELGFVLGALGLRGVRR